MAQRTDKVLKGRRAVAHPEDFDLVDAVCAVLGLEPHSEEGTAEDAQEEEAGEHTDEDDVKGGTAGDGTDDKGDVAEKEPAAPAIAAEIATGSAANSSTLVDEPQPHNLQSPGMVAATAACPNALRDELLIYALMAEEYIARTVQIVTPPPKGSLSKIIEESVVGQLEGTPTSPVGILLP